MTKLFCDRCNKEVGKKKLSDLVPGESPIDWMHVKIESEVDFTTKRDPNIEIDLCDTCYNKFKETYKKFMEYEQ